MMIAEVQSPRRWRIADEPAAVDVHRPAIELKGEVPAHAARAQSKQSIGYDRDQY
jgi:hypothetical protein